MGTSAFLGRLLPGFKAAAPCLYNARVGAFYFQVDRFYEMLITTTINTNQPASPTSGATPVPCCSPRSLYWCRWSAAAEAVAPSAQGIDTSTPTSNEVSPLHQGVWTRGAKLENTYWTSAHRQTNKSHIHIPLHLRTREATRNTTPSFPSSFLYWTYVAELFPVIHLGTEAAATSLVSQVHSLCVVCLIHSQNRREGICV